MTTTFRDRALYKRALLAAALGALLATGFGASAEPRQAREHDHHGQVQPVQKHKAQKQEHKQQHRQKADVRAAARPHAASPRRAAAPVRRQVERARPVATHRQVEPRRIEPRQIERRQVEHRQAPRRQVEPARSLASHRIAELRQRAEHQRSDRQRDDRVRQRAQDWQRYSQSRARVERERARRLQQQRRVAQYRYQQEYYRRVRAQQARLQALRYDRSRYYSLPASYRYGYGGNWYSTNRYGADMLRQAVNYGYQEGLRAGRADRYDRWRGGYRDSFAWTDGSYGYDNYYVSRGDYQYYFRQGFQRGYEDGLNDRYRYGRSGNDGTAIILGAVLAAILNLQSIG